MQESEINYVFAYSETIFLMEKFNSFLKNLFMKISSLI